MPMVTVSVVLDFRSGAARPFLGRIDAVLADTRTAKGFCDIHIAAQDDRVLIVEKWDSVDDYEAYTAWRIETGFLDALALALASPPAIAVWSQHVA